MQNSFVPRNGSQLFARAALSACVLILVYFIVVHAAGFHLARQGTLEGLRRAAELNPWNSGHQNQLSRASQMTFDVVDPGEPVRHALLAVKLGPNRAAHWVQLGNALELSGRTAESQEAFRRAVALFPNSPDVNWRLGNFYLRSGETAEALMAFRKSLLGAPELRQPVLDIGWRATRDVERILNELVPPRADLYFLLLNYLLDASAWNEADVVWARLLKTGVAFEPSQAFPYLDQLIRNQRVEHLEAAWRSLVERTPGRIRSLPADRNLLVNGDFEGELMNGGLDWRFSPAHGVTLSLDDLNVFDGTQSLRVQFDVSQNISYDGIYQYVPVQPGSTYLLSGYLRTQGITTDSGPRFLLQDHYDASRLQLLSETVTGTTNWSLIQFEFRAPPQTRLLRLRVVRRPSTRLENEISGTFWVDRVSIVRVESSRNAR